MPIPELELHDDVETTEPSTVTLTDRSAELDAIEAKGTEDEIPVISPSVTEPAQVPKPEITEPAATTEPVGDAPPADSDTVRRALAFGMTRDQVEQLQDLGVLNQVVQQHMAALMQQTQRPKEQPIVAGEHQPATPAEVKAYQLALDAEQFDPKLIEALTGMNTHYGKSIMALQQQLQDSIDTIRDQQTQWYDEQLDGLFGQLPDDLKSAVGEGPTRELDPLGQQYGNRLQVLQELEISAAIAERHGARRPSLRNLFERSVRVTFADRQKQLARNELAGKLDARQNLISHPPTNRKSAGELTVSPEKRAIASVKAILQRGGEQADEF